jgi:hypothetical protein
MGTSDSIQNQTADASTLSPLATLSRNSDESAPISKEAWAEFWKRVEQLPSIKVENVTYHTGPGGEVYGLGEVVEQDDQSE